MEENPDVPFCSDKVGLLLRPFRALARGAVKKTTKVCGSEERPGWTHFGGSGPGWTHTGRI